MKELLVDFRQFGKVLVVKKMIAKQNKLPILDIFKKGHSAKGSLWTSSYVAHINTLISTFIGLFTIYPEEGSTFSKEPKINK